MKKSFKSIGALVIAGAMAMSASANVFADTVVVSDDFEIHSKTADGVLLGVPEVKVYGDEIIVDGDFESSTDIGRYSGDALAYGVNSFGSQPGYLYKTTDTAHSGTKSLCINPNKTTGNAFSSNNGLAITLRGSIDERYKLEQGIYEAEIWVYTDAPNYAVGFGPHYNTGVANLNQNGSIMVKAKLESGVWTKLKTIISVAKECTEVGMLATIYSGYSGEPTLYPLYFDDFSLKKIENAEPKVQADDGNIKHSNQNGLPIYTQEGIRGTADEPKTVTVTCPISNNSEDDTTAMLISVLYNADNTLNSILGMTDDAVRDIYAGDAAELVNKFVIPADAPADCYLVNYVWDGIESAGAHMKKFKYPSHPYKLLGVAGEDDSSYIAGKNIPNTTWKSVSQHPTYSSWMNYPAYADQLMTGVSRNGMSSLYMPLTKNAGDSMTFAYRDFAAEAGHTYKVEFYTFDNATDYLAFQVVPCEGKEWNTQTKLTLTADTENTDFTSFQPTTWATTPSSRIRVYAGYNNGWGKITFTFTAAETTTHSVMLTHGQNGYVEKALSHTAQGVYIDDFTITDITPADVSAN